MQVVIPAAVPCYCVYCCSCCRGYCYVLSRDLIVFRLLVGHTHFDVDQRHSVLARYILGRLGPSDRGRRVLHSLSAFKQCVKDAHHDLNFFAECTANYNFDEWLKCMETKLEVGLSKHLQYQLRRAGDGVILARSKPRMSIHVPYSQSGQIWPVN